jgi:deoxycytidylate deaminase
MLNDNDIRTLMRYVYKLAAQSTDLSTNNGAILVHEDRWPHRPLTASSILAEGFNAHLPGYEDHPQAHERPFKYSVTEHAERAVIYNAAYNGVCTRGLTMIANWVACPDCARAIVLPGLKRVICHKQCMDRTPDRWADMVNLGLSMCENNTTNIVPIMQWDGEVGDVENLNNGEIWTP